MGRDIMQRDIEKEFSIRRSTASRTLQLMEPATDISAGSRFPYDARMKKLVVTEKGSRGTGEDDRPPEPV